MTLVSEHIEQDTRERILEVAERLFPRNRLSEDHRRRHRQAAAHEPSQRLSLFRFEKGDPRGVARRMMGGVEIEAERIINMPGPANASPAVNWLTTVHRMNCERYVGDSKLHEMVAIAMEEELGSLRRPYAAHHRGLSAR